MLLLILLVGTCASILAKPKDIDPPHYMAAAKELAKLENTIQKNIYSLIETEEIPDLRDYRRHYVEIVHVIFNIASSIGHSCLHIDYDNDYQKFINSAAPEAISDPKLVVKEIEKLSISFLNYTEVFQNLIKETCIEHIEDRDCDVVLDKIVHSAPKKYKKEAKFFLKSSSAVKTFNEKNEEFIAISKVLEAHKYVIQNPQDLKNVIYQVADVIRVVEPLYKSC